MTSIVEAALARRGGRLGRVNRKVVKRTAQPPGLVALLQKHYRVLAANAIAGGLAGVRPRSAPARVDREARRFTELVCFMLAHPGSARLARVVSEEVHVGSLAAAAPDEVATVFQVWRRALEAFLAGIGGAERARMLARGLSELEQRAVEESRRWQNDRIDVVVIGASAGGIQALNGLLAALDPDLPATLIVVQHVAPATPSLVPTILARGTRLTMAHAVEGAGLYMGHAYVAPPGRHLVVDSGRLHLVDGPPVHFARPSADVLFESAAQTFGRNLLSIVLSGSGADGATGTRAVHERGGVTFAQSPDSAEFRGMPEAAVATGTIDLMAPIPALAETLQRLVRVGRRVINQ